MNQCLHLEFFINCAINVIICYRKIDEKMTNDLMFMGYVNKGIFDISKLSLKKFHSI